MYETKMTKWHRTLFSNEVVFLLSPDISFFFLFRVFTATPLFFILNETIAGRTFNKGKPK